MPFGMLDTTYIDFPANVDVRYIQGLVTRSGVQFPRVLREIDARLGALNTGLDPLIASLIYPTDMAAAEFSDPIGFEITPRGEYTIARPQLVEGAAHMLPLTRWDVTLGFTEDGLERMSLPRILQNIDSMFLGWRQRYRREIFRRLFTDTEVRVDTSTVMTSPGFAGSGTGDNVFARPYPDGTALPGGYTHYYAVGAGTRAATIKAARDRLRKWNRGPFDLIASTAEIDLITAINPGDAANGFVSAGTLLVRPGPDAAEALVDQNEYLGVLFGDIRVRQAVDDFTDGNICVYKSYGALNPRNPLAWRFDPLEGRNAVLRYRSLYPLDNATMKQTFGIGVGNRTAAVLIDTGAAPYSPPTLPA